ncbi:thiamine pyrophosphate-binding protein [Streptomyces sp. ATMOS53]
MTGTVLRDARTAGKARGSSVGGAAYDMVAATLADLGVEVAFSLVGSSNFRVVERLRSVHGVQYVWARHESGAVAMADGWARASGKVGVATLHQGPGLTNALTPLVEAVKGRTPLLVVAGETSTTDRGSNQHVFQEGLVSATSAAYRRVLRGETAAQATAEAWRQAVSERRPVVLGLPLDVQSEPCPTHGVIETAPAVARPVPRAEDIDRACAMIRSAERPVLLAGRGAVEAEPELVSLAEACGAVLATTAPAKGMFAGSPWSVGISGGFSSPLAQRLLPESDLVISFGASLTPWTTRHDELIRHDVPLIAVNLDPVALSAHRPAQLALVGDSGATAVLMSRSLSGREQPEPRGYRAVVSAEDLADPGWNFTDESNDSGIDPRTLMCALDRLLPPGRTLVADSGQHIGWAPMHMNVTDPRGFVFTQSFMSLGLSLATGLGASLARPSSLTVVVVGDGGLLMSLGELDSLISQARHGAPILVVVIDDGAYGAEVHHFAPLGESTEIAEHGTRDFLGVATALGAQGCVVRSGEDLARSLPTWLSRPEGVFVLDCKINGAVVAHWAEEAFRSHA